MLSLRYVEGILGGDSFWTDAVIEPASANSEQSRLLKVPSGSPLIVAWRATLTENDEEIEFVKSVYRERFALTLDRHRIG